MLIQFIIAETSGVVVFGMRIVYYPVLEGVYFISNTGTGCHPIKGMRVSAIVVVLYCLFFFVSDDISPYVCSYHI